MKSRLLVLSTGEKGSALECVTRVRAGIRGRVLGVLQLGGTRSAKERLRAALPPGVIELIYSEAWSQEPAAALEWVVRRECRHKDGIWILHQELRVEEDLELWLSHMDTFLGASGAALALPDPARDPLPAFWVSPVRLPEDVPFGPLAAQPSLPMVEMLQVARAALEPDGLALTFPPAGEMAGGLQPFPAYSWAEGLVSEL